MNIPFYPSSLVVFRKDTEKMMVLQPTGGELVPERSRTQNEYVRVLSRSRTLFTTLTLCPSHSYNPSFNFSFT